MHSSSGSPTAKRAEATGGGSDSGVVGSSDSGGARSASFSSSLSRSPSPPPPPSDSEGSSSGSASSSCSSSDDEAELRRDQDVIFQSASVHIQSDEVTPLFSTGAGGKYYRSVSTDIASEARFHSMPRSSTPRYDNRHSHSHERSPGKGSAHPSRGTPSTLDDTAVGITIKPDGGKEDTHWQPNDANTEYLRSSPPVETSASINVNESETPMRRLRRTLSKSFKRSQSMVSIESRSVRQKMAEDRRGSNTPAATGQFIKSMLGAGILSMPKSFSESGLWLGFVALPILTLITMFGQLIIVKCKRAANKQITGDDYKGPVITYKDLGATTSNMGKWAVLLTIVCLQLCFCTGWVIVMSNNIHTLLPSISRIVQIVWLYPLLVLLSWIRYIKQLVYTSFLGLAIYVFGVMGVSFYYAFPNLDQEHYKDVVAMDWAQLPLFLSTLLYAYGCGFNSVLACEGTLKKPSQAPAMAGIGFWLYALMVLAFGSIMYVSGYGTCSVVLDCLPPGIPITVVKVLLTLALLVTFPLGLNVANEFLSL
ncbi:Proton-coupled amino acid transporter 4 [Pelomyxa schiedti]|nr:Proton-coupled amino acid transporter 4 [Pelomyxa schiedti]